MIYDHAELCDELAGVEQEYRKAFLAAERVREARNILVRVAVERGVSGSEIARATGLTRARISQLKGKP